MSAAAPRPRDNQGAPVPRYDGVAKVTGAARFASDFAVAQPAYAYLLLSDVARGRITAIDETAARRVPGVIDIITHRNRPALKPVAHFGKGGPALSSFPPLDGPDIRHAGQIVGLVLADSYEAAREAAHRVVVRTSQSKASATFGSSGLKIESRAEAQQQEDPRKGDAEAAFAAATTGIEAHYSTPIHHHNPIELFTTTASWDGDELTVHEPSQSVHALRAGLAGQLGLPLDKVRIISPYVGGGFGSKVALGHRTALVALAARQLGRPVKLVATREQGFHIAGHRQETRHHVKLGADAAGKFTAFVHDIDELTDRKDGYANGGIEAVACMYGFGSVASTARLVRADRSPPIFMRCPAELPPMFALESAIDELAAKIGIDPVELRRINDTRVNPVTGAPFTSRSLVECYAEAARAFGWSQRDPRPQSMRRGDWLIGYGCATATYPTQVMSATARVTLNPDGGARVEIASHDIGTGAYTVIQQAVAEGLAVPLDRVRVELGDSRLPPGAIAGGSVGTASSVSAIMDACARIAASLGIAGPITAGNRAAAFKASGSGPVEALGEFVPAGGESKSTAGLHQGKVDISGGPKGARAAFAFGAQFVEVHVHARTREIRVPRMTGAFAAGRIMNTRTAHSQLMGGMIWGLGSALHEVTEIDPRTARYTNTDLGEYLIPVNADCVAVDVILVPETDDGNPSGAKGIGELGNCGVAAAIANAVHHATGKRIRDLPITMDKLLA